MQSDLVIDVPPESQLHGPVVRKSVDVGDIELDPTVTLHTVTMPIAELGDDAALGPMVRQRLEDEWELAVDDVALSALQSLHRAAATVISRSSVAVRRTRDQRAVAAAWRLSAPR